MNTVNALINTPSVSTVNNPAPLKGSDTAIQPFNSFLGHGPGTDGILSEIKKLGLGTLSAPTTSVSLGFNLNANQIAVVAGTYQADNPAENMASENVSPNYTRPISVFDAAGNAHTINFDFLKTGDNTWAVEIVAVPSSDVKSSTNGQLASGTLTFNKDGSLASISPSLTKAINVAWSNGSKPSNITINWGTKGSGGPVTQKSDGYNATSIKEDGAPLGKLTGFKISKGGQIILSYDNGLTKTITLPFFRR